MCLYVHGWGCVGVRASKHVSEWVCFWALEWISLHMLAHSLTCSALFLLSTMGKKKNEICEKCSAKRINLWLFSYLLD